ncbi:MAG: hypothetical protein CUN55_04380, partial [Phototrophicales bacterium]
MRNAGFLWLMVGVLLLASVLRIYHLNLQGLWGDEGWSVEFSESANPKDVVRALVPDLHPPLYFMMLALWRDVAGNSEIAMRLLAVYSALLTVAILPHLTTNKTAGVIAALVLALSDKHVVLSQEVRHYPTAFLMMAVCSWLFLRWLKQPTRQNTLLYAISIIASVYIHYYTALILFVQLLYTLVKCHKRIYALFLMMALSMIAFLPWTFVAWYQLLIRPEGILHSMPLSWDTLEYLSVDFLGRPPILLLSLIGLSLGHLKKRQTPYLYSLLWFIVPIIITILVYPFVTVLTDRNMALLLLPIAILAGQGALWLEPRGRWLLAAIITINGVASLDSYQIHPPWRELATYVAEHYPANETVFMDVRGGDKALRYHLTQLLPADTEIVSVNQLRLDYGIYFLGVWEQYLQQNEGFWIAYWVNENEHWDIAPRMEQAGYIRTATYRTYHLGKPIELYHYDKLPTLDEVVALFGGTIRLHRVKYPSVVTTDTLPVSLWWSSVEPLSVSYSISVFLLNEDGQLVAQQDGPPQDGNAPTTQ